MGDWEKCCQQQQQTKMANKGGRGEINHKSPDQSCEMLTYGEKEEKEKKRTAPFPFLKISSLTSEHHQKKSTKISRQ